MKSKLSINLNKIALLRNSRPTVVPSVLDMAELSIQAGAEGITLHPRPDCRHVRPDDVDIIHLLLKSSYPSIELNIEGNPKAIANDQYPGFMSIIRKIKPHQVTLVPDSNDQLTSDHGWRVKENLVYLQDVIAECHDLGCRTSIFIDYDTDELEAIQATKTDRVEIYTEPYARAFEQKEFADVLTQCAETARLLHIMGIGINAGHDLNQENLQPFCTALNNTLLEVSIGHALTCDSLLEGWTPTVKKYLDLL